MWWMALCFEQRVQFLFQDYFTNSMLIQSGAMYYNTGFKTYNLWKAILNYY